MYKTLYEQIYTPTTEKKLSSHFNDAKWNFKFKKDVYVRDGAITKPIDAWINGKPCLDFGKGKLVALPGIKTLF